MAKRPDFSLKRADSFRIAESPRRPDSSPTGC